MKKVLVIAGLLIAVIPYTKAWAEIFGGNDCGDNCSWSLDTNTGVLTITGTGAMTNFETFGGAPWYSKRTSINSVQISDGITSIGTSAFYYTTLASVTIPDSVTTIGHYAFWGSQLSSVSIPDNVTSIGNLAFSDNNLTSFTIPNSVTKIGVSAFEKNQLETIIVPDSALVGAYAFNSNPNLTEITISPQSLYTVNGSDVSRSNLSVKCAEGTLSQAFCRYAQAYFDEYPTASVLASPRSIFGDMDISNLIINCRGEISECQAKMEYANYGTGPNQKGTYKLGQKQTDGSMKIFDFDGKIHYKGKRIYTIDEALEVSGPKNRFRIRYK